MAIRPESLHWNILSLCSGVAGLDLGADLALSVLGGSARTVCFVEREAAACAVLVQRMEEGSLAAAPVWDDLFTFDGFAWRGAVDAVIGGFPCTTVSVAGKRLAQQDERWLWPQFERIIREVRPRWLLLENVHGLLSAGSGTALRDVLRTLADCGFDAEWDVFRASDVGAPHRRARWFCLARLAHSPRHGERGSLGTPGSGRGVRPAGDEGDGGSVGNTAIVRLEQLRQEPGSSCASEGEGRLRQSAGDGTGFVGDTGHRGVSDGPRPQGRQGEQRPPVGGESGEAGPAAGPVGHAEGGSGKDGAQLAGQGGTLERAGTGTDGRVVAGNPSKGNRVHRGVDAAGTPDMGGESGGPVDDAGRDGPQGESCPPPTPWAVERADGDAVEHTDNGEGWRTGRVAGEVAGTPGEEKGREPESGRSAPESGCAGADLPLFLPGPGDRTAWQRILAVRPDLAPAIRGDPPTPRQVAAMVQREIAALEEQWQAHAEIVSREREAEGHPPVGIGDLGEHGFDAIGHARCLDDLRSRLALAQAAESLLEAEAKPEVRPVADGVSPRMGDWLGRSDQLRALGNAVLPACAAVSFLILYERLMENQQ